MILQAIMTIFGLFSGMIKETQDSILLLFDVDGTLTYSPGLTRLAFELAAEEIYGVKNATRGIEPHGRTDQLIFREILINNDLPSHNFDDQFIAFSQLYLEKFEKILSESEEQRVHIGVSELLEALTEIPGIYLALGTGNIEGGAYLKLKQHGIDRYFPVGGFGSDSSDRIELLTIAHQKAEKHYKRKFSLFNTWVIGDTPIDITCGQQMGASTIAVATGVFNSSDLSRFNPTAIFEDFSDTDRFVRIIQNHHPNERAIDV